MSRHLRTEIAELCRRIYHRHQRALDLIYEHRPDRAGVAQQMILSQVRAEDSVELDHCTKRYVRFLPVDWDLAPLRVGKGWTPSGRMLLFDVRVDYRGIVFQLYLGPGSLAIREAVFKAAIDSPLFNPSSKALNKKWNGLLEAQVVVSASELEELEEEALEAKISGFWKTWFEDTWPSMAAELKPVLESLAAKTGST